MSKIQQITASLLDDVRVTTPRLNMYAKVYKVNLANMQYHEKLSACREHARGFKGKRFYRKGAVRKEPYPTRVAKKLFPPTPPPSPASEEISESKDEKRENDLSTEERLSVDVVGEWDQFYAFPADIDLPQNELAMGRIEDDACICGVGKFSVGMGSLQNMSDCKDLTSYQEGLQRVCELRRKLVLSVAGREYIPLPAHACPYVVQLPYNSPQKPVNTYTPF